MWELTGVHSKMWSSLATLDWILIRSLTFVPLPRTARIRSTNQLRNILLVRLSSQSGRFIGIHDNKYRSTTSIARTGKRHSKDQGECELGKRGSEGELKKRQAIERMTDLGNLRKLKLGESHPASQPNSSNHELRHSSKNCCSRGPNPSIAPQVITASRKGDVRPSVEDMKAVKEPSARPRKLHWHDGRVTVSR